MSAPTTLMPVSSYTVDSLKTLLRNASIKFSSKMRKHELYDLYKTLFPASETSSPAMSVSSYDSQATIVEGEESMFADDIADTKNPFLFTPIPNLPRCPLFAPGMVLKKVQEDCVQFMLAREKVHHYGVRGGCVALKMGVGKTLATAYASLVLKAPGAPPTVVICSKTVMNAWKNEFTKFFPTARVLYLHTDFISRASMNAITPGDFDRYDFVVTCYDIIARNAPEFVIKQVTEPPNQIVHRYEIRTFQSLSGLNFSNIRGVASIFFYIFSRIIIDESHTISNIKTSRAQSVMAIIAEKRWCVTGTLMRNTPADIFSQFSAIGYNGCAAGREMKTELFVEQALNQLIFSQRDVETVLPPIVYHRIPVMLSEKEKNLYDIVEKELVEKMEREDAGTNYIDVLTKLTRLRQICCSSLLVKDALGNLDIKSKHFLRSTAANYSAKYVAMLAAIRHIPQDEKIIIFSSFAENLKKFTVRLNEVNIPHLLIDCDVVGSKRNAIIDRFQNGPERVLLLTYKIGSEGLTITRANHVFLCEPWYNNAVHNQAIARAYRTGQERKVTVYKFLCSGTYEEKVYQICEMKTSIENEFGCNVKAEGEKASMSLNMIRQIMNQRVSENPTKEYQCMICFGVGGTFVKTPCECKEPNTHEECLRDWIEHEKKLRHNPFHESKCYLCRTAYKI
jgi:SNF2 family DNA or RNA helicase